MASEITPAGSGAKMTRAQVRKYIRDMKRKQAEAREKLEEYKASWELEKEQAELRKLEQKLDSLNSQGNSQNMVDTSNWKFLSIDEFFEENKLYKRFLWFIIWSPKIHSIFTEKVEDPLKKNIEQYYTNQEEETRHIRKSNEYPNYFYVQTESGEYIIKM